MKQEVGQSVNEEKNLPESERVPVVALDILIIRENRVLLGLLSTAFTKDGPRLYGVPGRELGFREPIGDGVKRDLAEELGVSTTAHEVIAVNANYEFGNHYIGIGVTAEIEGDIQMKRPEDWDAWEWFDINALPENLFAPAKNLIESYKQHKITVSE